MSKYIESDIECPFYIKEGDNFIACEGLLNKKACNHTFSSDADKRQYETAFCCVKGGRNCPHYRAVAILYETGKRV